MKIGIVGSRRRDCQDLVEALVAEFPKGTVVISGGCKGVDTWAAEAATYQGLSVVVFTPDLPPDGSPHWEFTKAYFARNKLIAENCDVLYAFVAPDRKGGTENTIKHAKKLGKKIEIC